MRIANFESIATLLRTSRVKKGWSQTDLSAMMGMKKGQGQLVSNIERGKCNLSPKHGIKICAMLSIKPEEMIEAMVDDFRASLAIEFNVPGRSSEISSQASMEG